MADKEEKMASDADVEKFMLDNSDENEGDFDLDILDERKNVNESDDQANREHLAGEDSDDDAAAKITDAEIAALGKGDNEVEAGKQAEAKPGEPPHATTSAPAGEAPASTPPVAETPKPEDQSQKPTDQKPADPQPAPAEALGEQPGGEVKVPSESDIQQTYLNWRGQSEELLATQYYGLTPEVQAELELEPAKVIPRLMAKVYLDAMTASIGQMTMHFPRLVRLVNEQMAKENESENEFFKAWPQLKGKEEDIHRFGKAWRQLNPAASAQDFVNEVGAGVMVALRLDPTKRGAETQVPTGRTPAFVPGIGAPPRSPGKSPSGDNPFTQLNQEFEEDIDDDFS